MENTRYMKMTPVGLIPEDWDVATIKDYGHLLSDGINPQQYREKDFVEYSMPAYDDGQSPTKCKGADMNSNRTQIRGEVLLFNKLNVRQKRVWYIENAPSNALCSMEFLAFTSDRVDLRLLREILLQDSVTKGFESVSRGTSNSQKRIAPSDFLNFSFALPPLAEQHRIADALSGFDDMIVTLDKAIKKKRQIKEGLMQQLLTGKTRLPGFYGEWEELELGSILTYEQPGPFLVHSTDYVDSGVPVLTAGKTFILGYTNEDFGIYTNLPVIIFDDFVTESKYVDFPFKAKSSAMKMLSVRDKGRHNIRFIYDVMQLIDFPMTDHKRWWIAEYSHLKVRVPASIEEEDAIANAFFTIDGEIHGLEAQREKYALIKQGMMQELLIGKTRLI